VAAAAVAAAAWTIADWGLASILHIYYPSLSHMITGERWDICHMLAKISGRREQRGNN
jgi:hypothetical protein